MSWENKIVLATTRVSVTMSAVEKSSVKTAHHIPRVPSPTQKAFNVWGIIIALWALYRSSIGSHTSIEFDEFVFKPFLFLVPVVYYVLKFEHKTLVRGLWLVSSNVMKDAQTAFLVTLPLLIGYVYIAFSSQNKLLNQGALTLALACAMSLSEETLSRGFVARHIWDETHSWIKTIFQASLLHMFLRIPRIMTTPQIFGDQFILFVIADLLLSFVVTAVFLWRKSLLSAIIVRTIYTFILMRLIMS